MSPVPMTERDTRRDRASALNLHGLLAHWGEIASETWVASLLGWEEQERARRSLERRLRTAHIGRFKPLCDFDWAWPKRCDRAVIETLMTLEFLNDAANVVLVGPNGVGKSMIAQNIAHQALTAGTPCCSPAPANCSAISAHSTAIPLCVAVCAITPARICSSSTRSATSPTPIVMPI